MKIYLTLKSIPELSDLLGDERKRLWRRNALKAFRHRQTRIGLLVYATTSILGSALSLRIEPWIPLGYLVTGVVVAVSYLIFLQFWLPIVRIYIKEEREGGDLPKNNC